VTKGFVITGTDTGIGKTVVAAGLTAALDAFYWKPIQAGIDGPSDTEVVRSLSGAEPVRMVPEGYVVSTPCSPHEAARLDGLTIERDMLQLPEVDGCLLIEGAGGLMVPVNQQDLMIDLFEAWKLPVILVACTTLGTINHSLLSIEALRLREIEIAGVIFAGGPSPSSEIAIVERGSVAHLGRLPWLETLDPQRLKSAVVNNIKLDRLM
jgi:dethiobiotin synthetase